MLFKLLFQNLLLLKQEINAFNKSLHSFSKNLSLCFKLLLLSVWFKGVFTYIVLLLALSAYMVYMDSCMYVHISNIFKGFCLNKIFWIYTCKNKMLSFSHKKSTYFNTLLPACIFGVQTDLLTFIGLLLIKLIKGCLMGQSWIYHWWFKLPSHRFYEL